MPLVLGPLLIGFLPFAAALILIGLSQVLTAHSGSSSTGGFWDYITGRTLISELSGLAAKFARRVTSHWAASQLKVLGDWLVAMGTLTGWQLSAPVAAMESMVHAIERVMHRGDPRARAKAQTAHRQAVHAGRAATHANTHARSVGHALDHYKVRTNAHVKHLTHQTTVALPRDIARVKERERWAERQLWKVRDRTKALEDGAIKTWEWIKDHPAGAATAAFTGAVAIALDTLGLGGVRCPQFGNLFKKRGCGLWNDLDALLAGLAVIAGSYSLVEFAREEQKVMDEFAQIVRSLWEV